MNNMKVGDKVSATKQFAESDLQEFSKLSLDTNPLHLDAAYAGKSIFGQQIVHGLLVASLFSGLLGMKLPGEGSIYLGQSLSFKGPVFIGDEVTATVEIVKIRNDKPIVTLRTYCEKGDGSIVVDGEAVVKVPV
ncbi:MAG: MaoC family dehydratase [Candidatus Marinimicrobia bacterium]|nr:MaoC family dehydratase [Candidatus Neomarinimicrobiota bacterium]